MPIEKPRLTGFEKPRLTGWEWIGDNGEFINTYDCEPVDAEIARLEAEVARLDGVCRHMRQIIIKHDLIDELVEENTPPPNVPENGPGGSPEAADPVDTTEQDHPRFAPDTAGNGTGGEPRSHAMNVRELLRSALLQIREIVDDNAWEAFRDLFKEAPKALQEEVARLRGIIKGICIDWSLGSQYEIDLAVKLDVAYQEFVKDAPPPNPGTTPLPSASTAGPREPAMPEPVEGTGSIRDSERDGTGGEPCACTGPDADLDAMETKRLVRLACKRCGRLLDEWEEGTG